MDLPPPHPTACRINIRYGLCRVPASQQSAQLTSTVSPPAPAAAQPHPPCCDASTCAPDASCRQAQTTPVRP
eukprot:scaffold5373_cov103-Isochrysis_galbana.AAC.4